MGSQKINFQIFFHIGYPKVRLDERMVLELSLDNILPLFWPKNHPKIVEITILVYFDGFSVKT